MSGSPPWSRTCPIIVISLASQEFIGRFNASAPEWLCRVKGQKHRLHLLQRHILHQADDAIFTDLQPQTWKNANSQNNKIIRGSDHPATRNFLNQPLKRSLAPINGPEYQEGRKLKSNQWSQCLAHLTCGEVSGGVLLPRIAHHPRNFRGCSAYGLFLALA